MLKRLGGLFPTKQKNTDSGDSGDSGDTFQEHVRKIAGIWGRSNDPIKLTPDELKEYGLDQQSDTDSLNRLINGLPSESKSFDINELPSESESVDSQIKKIMEELNAIQKKLDKAQTNNELKQLQKKIDKKYKDYNETVFKEDESFQENKNKLLEKIEYIKLAREIEPEPQGDLFQQLINEAYDNEKLEDIQKDINTIYNRVVTQENNSVVKRNKQLQENKRALLTKLEDLQQLQSKRDQNIYQLGEQRKKQNE